MYDAKRSQQRMVDIFTDWDSTLLHPDGCNTAIVEASWSVSCIWYLSYMILVDCGEALVSKRRCMLKSHQFAVILDSDPSHLSASCRVNNEVILLCRYHRSKLVSWPHAWNMSLDLRKHQTSILVTRQEERPSECMAPFAAWFRVHEMDHAPFLRRHVCNFEYPSRASTSISCVAMNVGA